MLSTWSSRNYVVIGTLTISLAGLFEGKASAQMLLKKPGHHAKVYYVQAPAPAYAPAPAPAYAPTPAYYAPAPAYYASAPAPVAAAPVYYAPAPVVYYAQPKHGHHKTAPPPLVPMAPPVYYYPQAPYSDPAASSANPNLFTGYSPTANGSASILEAQKVLKFTPSTTVAFLDYLRKTYATNPDNQDALARITALKTAANDKFKEFRGGDDDVSAEEKAKLEDLIEVVVKEDNDRTAQASKRFGYDPYGMNLNNPGYYGSNYPYPYRRN